MAPNARDEIAEAVLEPWAQPRTALPAQPANGQRLVAAFASPTARRRPLYEGAARGESTKQRASARDCPRATLWQPSQLRLQALDVSATPSKKIVAALAIWPDPCLKSLQLSAPLQASSRAASRLREDHCEAPQSSAVKLWAQAGAGAAATFPNVSATQLDAAAAL